MKLLIALLSLTILASATISSAATAGPLQVKNLYPVFLHAYQPVMEKAALENSMSYSLSHSSTYTVQASGRWLISLDIEATELNFRYKRIILDMFEIGIDLPVLMLGGGIFDGFLESYHDSFGFPDYGRKNRPHNAFLYEIRHDGKLIIRGQSGIGLGDIGLSLKKELSKSERFTLSIKGGIELPTGNADDGFGNGSLDAAASMLADLKLSDKITIYLNAGAVFPGDLKASQTLNLDNFIFAGAGIEGDAGKGFSLLLQVLGQSAIFPDTGLKAVDRNSVMIAFGGRYSKGQRTFDLSLTEDLSEAGAPDFIINLTYKVKL
ncbi:MAG: DUF3187 family protein [Nitrospira sp.]|nr:DUF3187 family protein [bacterium]MBL7048675.1 DUF3187 family protein [Nitrospira sp.]